MKLNPRSRLLPPPKKKIIPITLHASKQHRFSTHIFRINYLHGGISVARCCSGWRRGWLLHCALSCAVYLIAPVCVFVCLFVGPPYTTASAHSLSRLWALFHYYYYYTCWHPSDYFRLFRHSLGSLLGALTGSFITIRREILLHVYWRILYWNAQPGVSATTRCIMPHFVYSLLTFTKCRCYSATVCRTSIKNMSYKYRYINI